VWEYVKLFCLFCYRAAVVSALINNKHELLRLFMYVLQLVHVAVGTWDGPAASLFGPIDWEGE